MEAPIQNLENTDVLVGPPQLRIRLFWFTTNSPINTSFIKVVHHLAVEVAKEYARDVGNLKQTRDDLAAVLKASHAQWDVIIGCQIFPMIQADIVPPSRPIIPQKRPADPQSQNSVVERTRIATDGSPGIIFLTTISVPASQVGPPRYEPAVKGYGPTSGRSSARCRRAESHSHDQNADAASSYHTKRKSPYEVSRGQGSLLQRESSPEAIVV
ncbi:uncharacterized protein EV420DRAFT_1647985 [Desarmillaria tabescens]|uniref:Uncharacterized protein n=1 Tax=Armillaria tabescens TaxID=1929756 RepID=A0AA39MTH5_ARMTA|nr:uncharacterized protein EV420DRAFT_1647985 [Desarmillaria tabescens]KAK0446551.1 hypothetical protein EV420DRAFT_1647985 [Desarmillaria tabescens]